MVHGLAVQSGGAMRAVEPAREWTTIDLWLPRAELDTRQRTLPGGEQQAGGVVPTQPRTILVVDDDPLVSMGTAAMLEDLGQIVVETTRVTKP